MFEDTNNDLEVSNGNGSNVTEISPAYYWTEPVAVDQVGDVYYTSGEAASGSHKQINVSVEGASSTVFTTNACPYSPDGGSSIYDLSGIAFTADGSKAAWFCQDSLNQRHDNSTSDLGGYIMYWNGHTTSEIYNVTGSNYFGGPENLASAVSMTIANNGSVVAFAAVDESDASYWSQVNASGTPTIGLYTVSTSAGLGQTPTTLDTSSGGHYIMTGDNGTVLALVDGGADVVYQVSCDTAQTSGCGNLTTVPLNGSGSPSPLYSYEPGGEGSGNYWIPEGQADSNGNDFLCLHVNSGATYYLCDGSGDLYGPLTEPDVTYPSISGYSTNGAPLPNLVP
jgi:hypothetical protein